MEYMRIHPSNLKVIVL